MAIVVHATCEFKGTIGSKATIIDPIACHDNMGIIDDIRIALWLLKAMKNVAVMM